MKALPSCSVAARRRNRPAAAGPLGNSEDCMKLAENIPKFVVLAVIAGGLGIFASRLLDTGGGAVTVKVAVPTLSPVAAAGRVAFDANCAQCHGKSGSGTEQGPPLVHDIYNPGHHSDEAFHYAVRQGVRQHHWPYGNMPAQPQVTDPQLAEIVSYVRELQQANGIVYKPHRM
jgi:mono/diheme cytochrome c family protein